MSKSNSGSFRERTPPSNQSHRAAARLYTTRQPAVLPPIDPPSRNRFTNGDEAKQVGAQLQHQLITTAISFVLLYGSISKLSLSSVQCQCLCLYCVDVPTTYLLDISQVASFSRKKSYTSLLFCF
ncbi:hypothetical protein PM082_013900 [Marasmius tenuissimus]|nr:hypothetical protein PM082_013900 [Marasmius tenuissimus]